MNKWLLKKKFYVRPSLQRKSLIIKKGVAVENLLPTHIQKDILYLIISRFRKLAVYDSKIVMGDYKSMAPWVNYPIGVVVFHV